MMFAAILMLVVGLCSALWHAFHARPLLPLDFLPLYLLVLSIGFRALSLLRSRPYAIAVLVGVVLAALTGNAVTVGTPLHVPSRHGAVILVLVPVFWSLRTGARDAWPWLMAALGLYALALVAKSLDTTLCAWVPIGLHWIWHTLGGAAAGVALHAVWQLKRPPQSLGSTTEDDKETLEGGES